MPIRCAPRFLLAVPVLVCAFLLGACGNSRTPVPDVSRPATPGAFISLGYPKAGVALRAPGNWAVRPSRAPLVTVVSSGPAIIAVWSYDRSGTPPTGATELAQARRALVSAARARDPHLQLIRAGVTSVGNVPAIELDAFELIAGHMRRVRSTHVFTATREVVLDEYSPPDMFHAVDHAVFSPVKRSLRLLSSGAA